MRHIFALDAGGSKCTAMLLEENGRVIGWGKYSHLGVSGRSHWPIIKAARKALGDFRPQHVHVAFVSSGLPGGLFSAFRGTKIELEPIAEDQAAFCLAEKGHGIVALAGTGAFVHVKMERGGHRHLRLDGRGPLMGDFGSGFYIGQKVLQAATRAHCHPRHKTSLAPLVLQTLGRDKWLEVETFDLHYGDRSTIASLATLANAQAAAGDEVSRGILDGAAKALAETISDAVDTLGLAESDYPLIGVGGVIRHSDIYWAKLCEHVREFAPNLQPVRLTQPSVAGVALTALKHLNPEDYSERRARLLETMAPFQEQANAT